ncbi:gamma carbonic anhydrase family protein [Campylobacterota bacterium]|nr:gamma carbonic anhydrase family protein [Campylobacterota bacterium]
MILRYLDFEPMIGERVFVSPSADVIGRVSIAEDCSIWFGAVIRADVNFVKIGRRSNVQDGAVIHVTHCEAEGVGGFPTIVGCEVTIGHRAVLHGCEVMDRCLIGMGAIVLDGAKIGEESIVGAGALVTMGKVFPPRSLILGSPARAVRQLTEREITTLKSSADRYVNLKNEYVKPKN